MTQVFVKYNPYRLNTTIRINGKEIEKDSSLAKVVKEKRLQEWVGQFPMDLSEELNSVDLDIEFYGTSLDWDDFEEAFSHYPQFHNIKLKYIQSKSDENIKEKIDQVFKDLQNGPIDDFRSPMIQKAYANIDNSIFPINVIATMSSGKSTLINALLKRKLMPSKNEACTAIVTEILDTDKENFSARVYKEDDNGREEINSVENLTLEKMNEINDSAAEIENSIIRIEAEGDIPFIDSKDMALEIVDTPGPNNSQNMAHKNATYSSINNDSDNLILYVLNGTQLSTNDDSELLRYVAEQIKKGGKQMRDRFLFVINKMDAYDPEEESIEDAIESAKRYLGNHGIKEPQIFPCSAYVALNIRTQLQNIDIDTISRTELKKLPSAARKTIDLIDTFNDFKELHLEKFSTLSPSAQNKLNYRLQQAIEDNNTKEQALIHCGIYSIEEAITAYVKKYAKTKRIKDLVDTFNATLEERETLSKAKAAVSSSEEAARECKRRADAIKEKISDGKEAAKFKAKLAKINPMSSIQYKAEGFQKDLMAEIDKLFKPYGNIIETKREAERLINSFAETSSNLVAKMATELSSVIKHDLVDVGEKMLKEYGQKIVDIDDSLKTSTLDFGSLDLIKGPMAGLRAAVEEYKAKGFTQDTVDRLDNIEIEIQEYYEKTGTKETKVVDGYHEEIIGTKKVKVGSHQEKVGTERVQVGSHREKYENYDRSWWQFWKPKYKYETVYDYEDKDIFETVDDYEEQDVTKVVTDYKTIVEDVFEKRTKSIEHHTIQVQELYNALTNPLRRHTAKSVKESIAFADEQFKKIKSVFNKTFDDLDKIIKNKYKELNAMARQSEETEMEIKNNTIILKWIETNKTEIDDILDI